MRLMVVSVISLIDRVVDGWPVKIEDLQWGAGVNGITQSH